MIKIGEKIQGQRGGSDFSLLVNDMEVPRESGYIYKFPDGDLYAQINDWKYLKLVFNSTFIGVMSEIPTIYANLQVEFTDLIDGINIKKIQEVGIEKYILAFEMSFNDFENWKNPFSIQEFADVISERINRDSDLEFKWEQEEDMVVNGCGIVFEVYDGNESINSFVESGLASIKKIYDEVINILLSQGKNTVLSIFNFPEQVRTPCEQYLLYFVQFLKELGIEATADIKHQAGDVLFSVNPISGHTALIQIRHALEIYLQMPDILSNTNNMQFPIDPKVQQLMANIQHLNGQLMLSNAISQAREETIQHQQVTIKQQQEIIDATIIQHSLLSISQGENNEKEEILGGTVSLTKIQGKGFEVNLPTIYRWIRNTLVGNR
ncbi:hypothetical protein AKG34_10235 [Peribacillus butanolivorans]|uniref:hypothetical protein n=1 Tax=Peribacillus butanolivorans TaxID=421767 RepID=UPI0006A731B8|nr:hypothetical protein [Peribacillus butanolivorans]KON69124.1 hypothetical protein AKG34_10235 [Peribacillus butanolivorans]